MCGAILSVLLAGQPQAAVPPAAASAQAEAAPSADGEHGRWFGRIGALGALYDSHARIATDGRLTAGASAHVSDNATVIFDVGYEITKNLSALVMVGFPPKPAINGKGTVSSLGELGKVRYGPVVMTLTYGTQWGDFHPYIGSGAAYAIILREFDGSVAQLHVHNNWGFVLQAGMEYRLSERWQLFVDYKKLWLDVNADGRLAGGAGVKAVVTLDPHLISSGVKFRF